MDDHPKQRDFVLDTHKRKIIRAGRRFGKTVSSAIMAVMAFGLGKSVDYGAPVIDQAAKFWHEIIMALAQPIEAGIFRKSETLKKIWRPGTEPEQYIQCHTVWNPDVLRGGSTDLLILDEFQMMHEDVWEVVCPPRLADRNGDAVFIYTPPSLRMRARSQARDPLYASKLFKRFKDDPRWLCMHGTSYDNPNISEEGLAEVSADLTQLARRQEIMAEDIEEVPGALWKLAIIDALRVSEIPKDALPLVRVVVGVDPSGSSTNEAGVVAAAKGSNGHGYVLADKSLLASMPRAWAQSAVWLYWEHKADRIVGERNFGGDMVKEVIQTVDENVSYRDVTATRGKQVRAEPIFALYEKGIIHHVGTFPEMEEEMISFVPEITKRSPNRMDACQIAGTQVLTSVGDKPIEYIRPGDYVATRYGYRRVLHSGMTGLCDVIDKYGLTGTPEHGVLSGNTFVRMDTIAWYNILSICVQKPWSSKEFDSFAILKVPAAISGFISSAARMARRFCSTVKCGKQNMALFLQGIISTIRTTILFTTKTPILNAFHLRSTMLNCAASAVSEEEAISTKYVLLPLSGTAPRKEENGIDRDISVRSRPPNGFQEYVQNVPKHLERSSQELDFALQDVIANTGTRHPGNGKVPVYNLEVEGQPEYFANGILVHNCVWALTELFPEGVRLTLANAINEAQDARVNKIIKVVTVEQTERCSACGKPTIVKRGPISHCTSCGAEFDSRKPEGDRSFARDRILK